MISTYKRLLMYQGESYSKLVHAHEVVRAYLLTCRENAEEPAPMIVHLLDRPAETDRNWCEAADWILAFDSRAYLDVHRKGRRADYSDELEGLMEDVSASEPDPELPES